MIMNVTKKNSRFSFEATCDRNVVRPCACSSMFSGTVSHVVSFYVIVTAHVRLLCHHHYSGTVNNLLLISGSSTNHKVGVTFFCFSLISLSIHHSPSSNSKAFCYLSLFETTRNFVWGTFQNLYIFQILVINFVWTTRLTRSMKD